MVIALAVDLGASGGKAFACRFDGRRLEVREIYRFPNDPVRASGHLHWDILRLLHELKQAIGAAIHSHFGEIASIGIDTWAVDFGLVDRHDELLGNPYHYRDEQTQGVMEAVLEIVPREEIFARTGIQFMPLNTLYQLYAIKQRNPSLLDRTEMLLMIPDLLRFFLTGEHSSEYTNASTTQFLNIESGDWDVGLLEQLNLPTHLLTEIVPPATPAGRLLTECRGGNRILRDSADDRCQSRHGLGGGRGSSGGRVRLSKLRHLVTTRHRGVPSDRR